MSWLAKVASYVPHADKAYLIQRGLEDFRRESPRDVDRLMDRIEDERWIEDDDEWAAYRTKLRNYFQYAKQANQPLEWQFKAWYTAFANDDVLDTGMSDDLVDEYDAILEPIGKMGWTERGMTKFSLSGVQAVRRGIQAFVDKHRNSMATSFPEDDESVRMAVLFWFLVLLYLVMPAGDEQGRAPEEKALALTANGSSSTRDNQFEALHGWYTRITQPRARGSATEGKSGSGEPEEEDDVPSGTSGLPDGDGDGEALAEYQQLTSKLLDIAGPEAEGRIPDPARRAHDAVQAWTLLPAHPDPTKPDGDEDLVMERNRQFQIALDNLGLVAADNPDIRDLARSWVARHT